MAISISALSSGQVKIEDTNYTNPEYYMNSKYTANIDGDYIVLFDNEKNITSRKMLYSDIVSPASANAEDLCDILNASGYFFKSTSGGGGGGNVANGTTNHSTLRWDTGTQKWEESLSLINNDTLGYTGGIYSPVANVSLAGFVEGANWFNVLSNVATSKTADFGYTTGANNINNRLTISTTVLNLRCEPSNTTGWRLMMDNLRTKISHRANLAGEITIYDNTSGAAVTDNVQMYPILLSAEESTISQSIKNAVAAAGDQLFINYNNTLAWGGSVMKTTTISSDTVLTGNEGWTVILCDTTSNAITIDLPGNAEQGRTYWIKDIGQASSNNITIDPVVGGIDQNPTYTINSTMGSVQIVKGPGTTWYAVAYFV